MFAFRSCGPGSIPNSGGWYFSAPCDRCGRLVYSSGIWGPGMVLGVVLGCPKAPNSAAEKHVVSRLSAKNLYSNLIQSFSEQISMTRKCHNHSMQTTSLKTHPLCIYTLCLNAENCDSVKVHFLDFPLHIVTFL